MNSNCRASLPVAPAADITITPQRRCVDCGENADAIQNEDRMSSALSVADNIASILTAIVAAAFWIQIQLERRRKRLRLETYLRDVVHSIEPGPEGACSLVHLAGNLGMSEAAVMEAAFNSKEVHSSAHHDAATGVGTHIMLASKRGVPRRL